MAGERGPLPQLARRRRNKTPATGRTIYVSRPVMPSNLSADAKAEWRRIVPELEQMGVLSKIDRSLLIRYCTLWSDWVEVNDGLQRSGKLVRGANRGTATPLVRNPLFLMRAEIETQLADTARQLMLGPTARIRAGIAHERDAPIEDDSDIAMLDDYRKRFAAL